MCATHGQTGRRIQRWQTVGGEGEANEPRLRLCHIIRTYSHSHAHWFAGLLCCIACTTHTLRNDKSNLSVRRNEHVRDLFSKPLYGLFASVCVAVYGDSHKVFVWP